VLTARKAEDAARRSLDIVRMQMKYEQVSQIAVLNAQRTFLLASLSRVQAEAIRLADTAGLFVRSPLVELRTLGFPTSSVGHRLSSPMQL
jgi:hypothetical protein